VKLLLYSHYFAPSIGGVETIVESLARGLAELRTPDDSQEFTLTLVTDTPQGTFDDQTLPFPVLRRPRFCNLYRMVRAADVVHIAGPSFLPMLLAWIARKPFVVEHHTYQAICPNGLLIHQPERSVCPGHFQAGSYGTCWRCECVENGGARAAMKLFLAFPRRALVRRAAGNIAVSEHVEKRIAMPRTSVVLHGIAQKIDNSEGLYDSKGGKSNTTFAFVGRFVAEKGGSVLVEALARLLKRRVDFRAKFIGDGPERRELEARIAAAGLGAHVTITGYLTGQKFAEAVKDVTAVVMPSVWEETAGLSAMEQMVRGRVVIASDIGGLGETVGDAGLKFPAGDVAALADCLEQVVADPELAAAKGRAALEKARQAFSLSQMIEKHRAIYLDACQRQ